MIFRLLSMLGMQLCNASVSSSPTFLVPQGKTFLLQPLSFNGECNSNNSTNITFQAIILYLFFNSIMFFTFSSSNPCLQSKNTVSTLNGGLTLYQLLCMVQIDGNIIAPSNPFAWKCNDQKCHQWITFENFDGLFIQGSGTINGQGKEWWNFSCKDDENEEVNKFITYIYISQMFSATIFC